jgi:WD40 repeat protein
MMGAIAFGDSPYLIAIDDGVPVKSTLSLSNELFQDVGMASCIKLTEQYVYVSTTKGLLYIYDLQMNLIYVDKLTQNASISGINFSRNYNYVVTNATDRTIRVFYNSFEATTSSKDMAQKKIELLQKFTDSVDKNQWVDAAFNPDGEYLIGGSTVNNAHSMYFFSLIP